jgi:origin recognition complex subunit 6
MDRAAAERNLYSLLPSVGSLPAELIDLTVSLLSQSRSKAGNLKPEEEIGRGYACANIACERYFPSPNACD